MSDEEYDEELPPISVNTSFSRDSQELLRMPTAEELASQRAREAECERELEALRAADAAVALHAADSSGSEGEAALAAAVTAMRVQAAARAAPPALADSLVPMLTRLPQDYVPVALLESLREATPATLATLTEDVCEASLSGQLGGCDEACVAGAWLCAASLGAGSRGLRRRSRRALHALLGRDLFADPHGEASRALSEAVAGGTPDALVWLELADALAPAAPRLHGRLLRAALAALLNIQVPPEETETESCWCAWALRGVASAWSGLDAAAAGAAVRAAGRAARACVGCAWRARLLSALAAPPAARAEPDRLEVLVAASKLQLLFRE